MEKLSPRAVIFDLGSTLIEYEAVPWSELNIICAASVRSFLVKQGHDLPDEDSFYKLFEEAKAKHRKIALTDQREWTIPRVTAEMLDRFDIRHDEVLIDRTFEAYYKPVAEKLFVYSDTLATLEKIKQVIPVVGLISNTIFPERAHRRELKQFKIEPYLDFAVFSSTFGLRKPHSDIFIKAANLAGCAPKECVYIGDRYLEDIEGPSRIGMAAILKEHPVREYPDQMPLAVRRINTLAELSEHLEI